MGRWTPDEHGCIYDEAGCFARLTPNKAERLASRHNADIDALTAELAAANTTLGRLREAVPEVLPPHMSWKDSLDGARAILNPENET